MRNPVFLSGPHGGGKNTLMQALLKHPELFVSNDLQFDFTKDYPIIKNMSHFERTMVRLLYRAVRDNRARELAKGNPGKVVITDRSVSCSMAYAHVYKELGWISGREHSVLRGIGEKVGFHSPTIILNPPVETIMKRIAARTQRGTRVERDALFREEDSKEFVTHLHDAFEAYSDYPSVLVIRDNTKKDITRIIQWIKEE